MSEIKDGGPAFPVPDTVVDDKIYHAFYNEAGYPGMTLRDYFAASYLSGGGAYHQEDGCPKSVDDAAADAYRMADAMLKARME